MKSLLLEEMTKRHQMGFYSPEKQRVLTLQMVIVDNDNGIDAIVFGYLFAVCW